MRPAKGTKKTVLKVADRQRQASAKPSAKPTPTIKGVKPIAVYPATEALRQRIHDAAEDHGNSMSGFLIYLFRQYEKNHGAEARTA